MTTTADVTICTDAAIEDVIADAARRMTDAEPTSSLRASVMARIATSQPRTWWRWQLVGGTLAMVALVTTVGFFAWPRASAPAGVRSLASNVRVAPPASPAASSVTSSNAAADPTLLTIASSPVTSVVRTVAALDNGRSNAGNISSIGDMSNIGKTMTLESEEAMQSREVPALELPKPIVIEPLSSVNPVKQIEIEPLRVAPIVVTALADDQNQ